MNNTKQDLSFNDIGQTERIHQTYIKAVRQKNVKVLVSVSVTYEMKICNQYVQQAYIQARHLGGDIHVVPDRQFRLTA